MSMLDLKAKYGRNLKDHEAVSRAIREEITGGNAALDGLNLINGCARQLHDKRGPEWTAQQEAATAARAACLALREAMAAEIARRYNLRSASTD